jgi:hypothetical protein
MNKIKKLALKALPFWDPEAGFCSIHEDWCEINNLKPLAKVKVPGAKEVKSLSYAILSNTDKDFWASLEVLPAASFLKYLLSNFHGEISILTSPVQKNGEFSEECMKGKVDWIHKHVSSEINIIFDHEKEKYATKTSLLIDDRRDKLSKYKEAGGQTLSASLLMNLGDLQEEFFSSLLKMTEEYAIDTIHIDMDGTIADLQRSLKALITEAMNSL